MMQKNAEQIKTRTESKKLCPFKILVILFLYAATGLFLF